MFQPQCAGFQNPYKVCEFMTALCPCLVHEEQMKYGTDQTGQSILNIFFVTDNQH